MQIGSIDTLTCPTNDDTTRAREKDKKEATRWEKRAALVNGHFRLMQLAQSVRFGDEHWWYFISEQRRVGKKDSDTAGPLKETKKI